MRHALLLAVLVLFTALPAAAQSSMVGFNLGIAQPPDDGFDVDFDQSLKEAWFGTEIEPDAFFKVKLGQMESDNVPAGASDPDGKIDFVTAVIEYRFSEIFGSSGLFAGGGYYRQDFGSVDETNWGLHAGVNGHFPVTRRFALSGELAYHWIRFEERESYYTASAGLVVRF